MKSVVGTSRLSLSLGGLEKWRKAVENVKQGSSDEEFSKIFAENLTRCAEKVC